MNTRHSLDTIGRELGAVINIVDPLASSAGGALAGVPVAVKANIAVTGQAWSAAIDARRELMSVDDAPVVRALRREGADIVAMLNMAEAALGATTNNEAYGIGHNPQNRARTCGGSSGGSGAVVGAGLVPLALGTDTMGSVRVPASYCGCVGFKPSNGLVSLRGVVPLSTLLDCVGPLAVNVTTAIAALRVMCAPAASGPWSGRAATLNWDLPAALPRRLVVPTEVLTHDLEPDVDAAFERVIELLRDHGVEIVEQPLGIDLGLLRRRGLLLCEAEGAAFHADLLATHPEGFSESLRSMLAFGASKSAVDLARALTDLQSMGAQVGQVLDDAAADSFLTPTTPQVAFPVDARVPADQADFTAFANVAGLPAISLPCGRDGNAMPIGIQLIGRRLADDRLAAHALALEALVSA